MTNLNPYAGHRYESIANFLRGNYIKNDRFMRFAPRDIMRFAPRDIMLAKINGEDIPTVSTSIDLESIPAFNDAELSMFTHMEIACLLEGDKIIIRGVMNMLVLEKLFPEEFDNRIYPRTADVIITSPITAVRAFHAEAKYYADITKASEKYGGPRNKFGEVLTLRRYRHTRPIYRFISHNYIGIDEGARPD